MKLCVLFIFSTFLPLSNSHAKSQLLWDSWYTMTIQGKQKYGYYNDRVEKKDGKFAYQNQMWKREEGYINEEKVVSFGKDDSSITPLLFNLKTTYRETELTVDGTFKEQTLVVKARKGKVDLPRVERHLSKKTFLSTLFQVWLGKQLGDLKEGKRVTFLTVFEDALDSGFAPANGYIQLEPADQKSNETKSKKLTVETAGTKSTWYVLDSGEAIRIEKPDQGLVVEKVTEGVARRFLIEKNDAIPDGSGSAAK